MHEEFMQMIEVFMECRLSLCGAGRNWQGVMIEYSVLGAHGMLL